MPRRRYLIRPLDMGLSYAHAALHSPAGAMLYPAKNIKIDQHSVKKRWGYSTAHRTLTASADVLNIIYFKEKDGTENTLYLTGEDLCLKKTGTSETFQYVTETYTTGTISSISGTTVTGSGTAWNTNAAAGDFFIMDDDHSANIEPDANWTSIASVTDDTHLELSSAYTKNGTTYKIRNVYTTPSNEYWSWAIVNNTLCFSNGNTDVHKWTGSGYAADLESGAATATKARYLKEYASRLIIADYGSTRDPYSIAWSKNLDPTDWSDASYGSAQLLDSADYITGLGKVGAYLAIFKEESYHLAHRTGIYTEPINIPIHKKGIGCIAAPSIIEFQGTVAWLGRDDFYTMSGTWADSIGEEIRDFFFDDVTQVNAEKVFGIHNPLEKEIIWFATTTTYGQLGFVWRYKNPKGKQWVIYDMDDTIKSGGRGA